MDVDSAVGCRITLLYACGAVYEFGTTFYQKGSQGKLFRFLQIDQPTWLPSPITKNSEKNLKQTVSHELPNEF